MPILSRHLALVLLVLALMPAVGCQSAKPRPDPSQRWIHSELYFGRNIGEQEGVSEEAWSQFLDKHVSARFPDGLTVTDGRGQYRESPAQPIIKERCKVLLILHKNVPENRDKIKEIIDIYKTTFKQNSVLWVEQPARVSFR